jgi:hypothetical protein
LDFTKLKLNLKLIGCKNKMGKIKINTSNLYENYFNNKEYSDFIIVVGGEEIYCHKIIINQNCTFFKNEKSEKIEISEDCGSFKKMIQFFYSGTLKYDNSPLPILKLFLKVNNFI